MPSIPGRPRVLLAAAVVAAIVFSVVTLVVRTLPLTNLVALVIAVGSPYVPLVALSGLFSAVRFRRRILSIAALTVVVATVVVQMPWYYSRRPADVGFYADIRVLSSNLRNGQSDASAFVAMARESADVITVSELTPEAVLRFSKSGIDDTFPFSVLIPAQGAGGIGLWSRFPVTEVILPKHQNTGIAAARVQVPGLRLGTLVASVHIMSPVASETDSFDGWRLGITATHAQLDDFAAAAGPGAVIVAGDFNSTPDMRQFRDLLTNGYRDSVDQTGAGFAPTFPSNEWFPPVITIDHVLTRNAAAAAIKTVTLPGSDHRSLLAAIHVPLDPAAP
jgi:endonuclease/exonuclease/phosphatase (EEP) superfamily protein YafD